jgi:hypothetical protein
MKSQVESRPAGGGGPPQLRDSCVMSLHRVNIPNRRFVGVGEVVEAVKPVKDFYVESNGTSVTILEAPLAAERMGDGAEDEARSEYLVRVILQRAVPASDAVWE